jgi:hypothetical protein
MAALGVSHPLIAEDAKPPGGQLMAAPRPNLGIAAQSGQSIHAVLNIARVRLGGLRLRTRIRPPPAAGSRGCNSPTARAGRRACSASELAQSAVLQPDEYLAIRPELRLVGHSPDRERGASAPAGASGAEPVGASGRWPAGPVTLKIPRLGKEIHVRPRRACLTRWKRETSR